MKRNVQLYIAGRPVDLGDDSWILYNWTREDLSNPTAVVNSSSHQVQLPGTCRNNSLFGAVFRLDRRTLFGIRYDGPDFDPTRKTPFALYADDGTVLEAGYCRLDAVDTHSRRHAYTVTLYGGLGSFFYTLASNEDGTPRTLADLTYKDADGADVAAFTIFPGPDTVQDAWRVLGGGEAELKPWWNVLNFAPCYNGLPDDFDASHALMDSEAWENMPAGMDEDGERGYEYTYKAGLNCALVSFTNPHTEWELADLRWYLQRPVISVKAFIAACCDSRNNGGYTVTLDPSFFRADNPAYADAWWTMSMIATADRTTDEGLVNVLKASKTPMQYLVDYCKAFGLMFLWDNGTRSVRIVTRATFYGENPAPIDLSTRIDRSQQMTQDPVLADKRWYQMGDGGSGEFVEQYRSDYGKGYGTQRIDTGYQFDAGTTVLTEGSAFKDAAEVSESDLMFSAAERVYNGRVWQRFFQLPRWEKVTFELWNDAGESKSFDMACDLDTTYYDNPDHPLADWLPKVQLHGAENKSQDGADVLLYFSGVVDTPVYSSGSWNVRKSYFLTADTPAMTDLAGGPCWDLTRTGIQLVSLPSFRRVVLAGNYIAESFEWGAPEVRPVPDISYPSGGVSTIFARWWKAYLADRYAADTRVLTCRVDLRGLPVGQALLRRFYWLDGALWTMNAIRNHSLTSYDLTEIELVKVQDRNAYILGPGNEGAQFLTLTPAASGYNVAPGGETLTITVRSSSAWTMAVSPIVSWLTASAASGPAGTTVVTFTVQANNSGSRRTADVTFTNADGIVRTFTVAQAARTGGSISISPALVRLAADGSTRASANVNASDAWAVDPTTVPAWLTVATSSAGITVTATANSGEQRTASLKVYLTGDTTQYATLSVLQLAGAGGNGGITLLDGNGNNAATVAAAGESLTLYITIPDGDDWTVSKSDSWITVSPASGSGNTTLAVTIPNYTGSAARQGTITAKRNGYTEGAIFYITQQAPAASTDYIQVTRRDNSFYNNVEISNGVEYEGFDVRASGAWTAATSNAWLHVYGDAWSGTGNKTCWFQADANTGSPRTGTIVATLTATGDTATFYVYQGGNGTVTLAASLNKSRIDSTAQELALSIVTQSGVAWTITNVSSGLSPRSLSGTGPATVIVDVSATSVQRTLSLRVNASAYGLSDTASVVQTAPSSQDTLVVTPFGTVNVAARQTSVTFTVQSSTSWRCTGPATVLINPASGSGNGTVTVTFDENTSQSPKTYPITFETTSGTAITVNVSIVQAASSESSISVTPSEVTMAASGDSKTLSVTASGAWTASKSASWIGMQVTSGSSGTSTVTVTAHQNTGEGRTGTITFACGDSTVVVYVYQGTDAVLSVSSNAASLGYAAGQTAQVTVFSSLAWAISADTPLPSWLSASYPQHSGSASGETLTFTAAAANSSADARSTTVRVELIGDTTTYADIVVTQAGQSVIYASPLSISIGAGSAERTIELSSNTDWHISNLPSGVTIEAQYQTGTGNATIPMTVAANPLARDRVLTISFTTDDNAMSASVIVTQAAREFSIASAVTIPASGERQTAVLVSSTAWSIDTDNLPEWLLVTPTSGDATNGTAISFVAASYYTTNADRSASIPFVDAFGNRITCVVTQTRHASSPILLKPEYEQAVVLSGVTSRTGTAEVECAGAWTVITSSEAPQVLSVDRMGGVGNGLINWTVTGISTTERTSTIRVRTVVRPEAGTMEETYEAVLKLVYKQSN